MSTNTNLPNLLLVDDSATIRAMIRRVLAMLDISLAPIHEAENGAKGLDILANNKIDLILADLNMPVMDGFEMIRRIRENPSLKHIPIVVISAQPDQDEVGQLEKLGISGYLPKPFTAEGFRSLIAPILEHTDGPAPHAKIAATTPAGFSLAEALAEALESLAFITPEQLDGPDFPSLPTGTRVVRVDFHSNQTKGSFALAAAPELGETVAANLDDMANTGGDDALKELANITCGLLLRMRPGGATGFHLEPPTMSLSKAGQPRDIFKTGDLVAFDAEGQVIAAQVVTDGAFNQA